MSVVKNNLQNRVAHAAKWSAITEIVAKMISPITTMILARILAPEVFGAVAMITMVISFADMFTDAGFQKYLVQHEFKDDDEKYKNINVAFWTNIVISFLLWGIIVVFGEPIARLVGNPGLGSVIAIACIQLPITSFSSIQMALYRRDFDFKTLFWVRLVSISIPLVVTIPLALGGLGYWSLIIGTISGQLSNAIILTFKSKWKPKWFYSIGILREMFSFSIWTLIESISIWLTAWVDAFIIGSSLSSYYLGLYMTSTTLVNALMAIITASTVPVLFSTLSRLQNDPIKFERIYFTTQRLASIFIFPLGIGIFLYSDFATQVLLGNQWGEASHVIGIWALTSSIVIVFGHYCSEVYRSKGRPKLSFLAQILHLIVLVPVCIISSKYGFWPLVYARSLIRLEFVLVHFIIMKVAMGISVLKTLRNVVVTAISAGTMGVLGFVLLKVGNSLTWMVVSIGICIIAYFGILSLFPSFRAEMTGIIKRLKSRSE